MPYLSYAFLSLTSRNLIILLSSSKSRLCSGLAAGDGVMADETKKSEKHALRAYHLLNQYTLYNRDSFIPGLRR